MPEVVYQGLEKDGVPLIGADEEGFGPRLRSIRENSWWPVPELVDEPAAILVNLTGQTILAFGAIWKRTDADGVTHTQRIVTLSSSGQMDALRGPGSVRPDANCFVLPGSQRLIMENEVYGDNFDVIPPEMRMRGGFAGASRTGDGGRGSGQPPVRTVLTLDVVFLEDGLVLGPDEMGLFDGVGKTMEEQRATAAEMAAALARGATPGVLLDMVRPMALAIHARRGGLFALRSMFLQAASRVLLYDSEEMIRNWVEKEAAPSKLTLRRVR